MKEKLLLFFLTLILINVGEATLPPTIFYSVTVRSFLPNFCRNANFTYDSATAAETRKLHCPNDTRIIERVVNGEIGGHPDFNPDSSYWPNIIGSATRPYNGTYAIFGRSFPVTYPGSSYPYVLSDLTYDTTGIPKMKYCKGEEGYTCDVGQVPRVVFSEDSFYWWHRDNPYYSIRNACRQTLTRVASNRYVFNGGAFYNPTTSCRLPTWPLSVREIVSTSGRKYSFTSEIHTSFQYNGTEVFTFAGDDDVHVYINGRLAVNLAGIHPSTTATIILNQYERELNITTGGIYQFDLFHAERQVTGSNYLLTTTLAQTCNVVSSSFRNGDRDVSSAINWTSTGNTTNSDWLFISGPGYGYFQTPTIKKAILMAPKVPNVVSYLMHKQRVNVGSGLALNFDFNMTGDGHGFAILFHDRELGLTNYNGGTGPNLGIKNIDHSLAIVFDMCPHYPDCSTSIHQLRVHFKITGDLKNSVSTTTRSTYDPNVYQNWKDGQKHSVEVLYYEQPDWLEVYVDNSLRLVERGFSIQRIIGGRDAYIGFSSASSNQGNSMQVEISNVVAKTIKVVTSNTLLLDNSLSFPKTFVANGLDSVVFSLQTSDACKYPIQFGGLSSIVHGRLVATSISDQPPSIGRRLNENSTSTPESSNSSVPDSLILLGEVVDNKDGSYNLKFKTAVLANFTAHIAIGSDCIWNGTSFLSSEECKTFVYQDAAISIPFSTNAPTLPFENPGGLDTNSIIGIGVAVGTIAFCGSILILFGIRYRNQWRRDKKFIETGQLAVIERDMNYVGDADLDMLQNKLQATRHAIKAERAKKMQSDDKQHIIDDLNRQLGEIQETIRQATARKMQENDQPSAFDHLNVYNRVRRTIVRQSFRKTSVDNSHEFNMQAENPLFSHFRMSLGLKKKTQRGLENQINDKGGAFKHDDDPIM